MEQDFILEVGGEKINLAEKGKGQMVRTLAASKFLNQYGLAAIRNLQFDPEDEEAQLNGTTLMTEVLSSLDYEALLLIGRAITGKENEFIEEHFDLEWIVDGVFLLVKIPAFEKIRDRFFGNAE